MAALVTGLAVVVVAAFAVAAGAAAVLEGAAPPVCVVPVVLAGDIAVVAEVPPDVPAGAHGTLLAVVDPAAAGAAGVAVFFLPKSDPKFEIAADAFEIALLAPAAVCPPAEFAAPATVLAVGLQGGKLLEGLKAVACPGAPEDTPLVNPR